MTQQGNTVNFSAILEELLDNTRLFSPGHLNRFSDISKNELEQLKRIWPEVQRRRKIALMEDLEELLQLDTLVCFDDLAIFALDDDEPPVRATAISMLWDTNDSSIAERLMRMVNEDAHETVRAAAAGGLGIYVYQGELEEIPQKLFKDVEKTLLRVIKSKDKSSVRRKGLEALGFSSHADVPALIQDAFTSSELTWRICALYAMGRSADSRWADHITKSLHDPEPEIVFEAIRSAGELGMKSARQTLLEMLLDEDLREDEEVTREIIWSLSKIGGENVREALTIMQEQMLDEEDIDFIEEALENLEITEGLNSLALFDIELLEDEDSSFLENLSNNS